MPPLFFFKDILIVDFILNRLPFSPLEMQLHFVGSTQTQNIFFLCHLVFLDLLPLSKITHLINLGYPHELSKVPCLDTLVHINNITFIFWSKKSMSS